MSPVFGVHRYVQHVHMCTLLNFQDQFIRFTKGKPFAGRYRRKWITKRTCKGRGLYNMRLSTVLYQPRWLQTIYRVNLVTGSMLVLRHRTGTPQAPRPGPRFVHMGATPSLSHLTTRPRTDRRSGLPSRGLSTCLSGYARSWGSSYEITELSPA